MDAGDWLLPPLKEKRRNRRWKHVGQSHWLWKAAQLGELSVKQTGPRLDAGGATFLLLGLR